MSDPEEYDALRTEMLLSQVSAGDHDAWREIYRRYRPCMMLAISEEGSMRLDEPDDVLQSAFLSAWKDIEKFKYQGKGSFRAWLRKIVVNKNIKKLEKERSTAKPGGPSSIKTGWLDLMHDQREQDPAKSAEEEDSRQLLAKLMEKHLKPIECEVLILRHFEGLSVMQVAEIVELSETSVKNKYRTAMERIAHEIKEQESHE